MVSLSPIHGIGSHSVATLVPYPELQNLKTKKRLRMKTQEEAGRFSNILMFQLQEGES